MQIVNQTASFVVIQSNHCDKANIRKPELVYIGGEKNEVI